MVADDVSLRACVAVSLRLDLTFKGKVVNIKYYIAHLTPDHSIHTNGFARPCSVWHDAETVVGKFGTLSAISGTTWHS